MINFNKIINKLATPFKSKIKCAFSCKCNIKLSKLFISLLKRKLQDSSCELKYEFTEK